ncbi:cobalt ECF transporter T component CbiQ [Calidifontibacillus oryziterrae]|uniref:cobalt ECF transporter T component CbiQ n=1 Tax=Calidifontibacillus oryziterrae TaxID=1191699 RepID=UPI00031B7680|nr:cobalt ECF transporter T component CbiQ [Calidifontibacillus oryziterrae]
MNQLSIEQYVDLSSPIHKLDTRFKIIGIFILIFSIAFVTKLAIMTVILCLSIIVALISRLPLLFILKRLKLPSVLIFVVALLTLFFSNGSALIMVGPFIITKEGLSAFLLIIIRFISIIILMVILFATTPFSRLLQAMRTLGVPALLCDMMLFSYRYIFELWEEFRTMKTAMNMRGFKEKGLRSLKTWSLLTGTLFIRSYEQSERVYHAMTMRGYGHAPIRKDDFVASLADYTWLVLFIFISSMILISQFFI